MIAPEAGITRVRLVLSRNGKVVTLKTPTQSEDYGDDPLNNSPTGSHEYIPKAEKGAEVADPADSKILCARYYETEPEAEDSGAGQVTHDRPRLAFPARDISVTPEEEDRLEYGGTTYELRAPREYSNFISFEARNVNE